MQPRNTAAGVIEQNPGLFRRLYTRYGAWTQKISGALLDQALFAGSNFLLNVLLARWMMPDNYGAFVVAYSWFLLPQNFYDAMLIEPMLIFGSGKYAKRFRRYLGFVYAGHLLVAGIIALVLALGALVMLVTGEAVVAAAILGAAIASPMLLTRWLTRQPFYVLSKPHWSALGGLMYLIFAVTGLFALQTLDAMAITNGALCAPPEVLCSVFAPDRLLTPFSAMLVMGFAGLISSIVLTLFLLKPRLSLNDEEIKARGVLKSHWDYGKWSTGTRFLTWIQANVYYIAMAELVSLADSGALRAVANMVMPLYMTMTAITAILLPSFVRTYERGGKQALDQRVWLILRAAGALTGAYWLFLTFFGTWLIDLLYAGRYNDLITLPILFTIGMIPFVSAMNTVLGAALRAIGQVRNTFYSKTLPTVLTMTVGVFLMAQLGILGANIGQIITAAAAFVFLMRFYLRPDVNVKATEDAASAPSPPAE